jgi:hypothetical protein
MVEINTSLQFIESFLLYLVDCLMNKAIYFVVLDSLHLQLMGILSVIELVLLDLLLEI